MRRWRQGELRLADAAAQVVVQQQRQLPGGEQDVLSLQIVGTVVGRIEDVLQVGGGLVIAAGMSVGDRRQYSTDGRMLGCKRRTRLSRRCASSS